MIIDLINKLMKYVIIIALISLVSTWAFNIQNVLITESTYNGITIKTVDFRLYLLNMQNAWQTNALQFEDILIDREWVEIEGNITQSQFWEDLGNNMAFLFDCLYFPINFVLWINRWICWLLNLALTMLGWNTMPSAFDEITGEPTAYYSNLAYILNWITRNFFIPYV